MAAPIDSGFQAYIKSIANKYQHWCDRYTLTDVQDRQRKQSQFSPFDFGLIVQTVQPKQSPRTPFEDKTEKVELLPVLHGIRKYVADHVLLVGRSGSGKSTALAQLLWEEADKLRSPLKRAAREIIPVLVELRYWQTSVFERIQAFLQQHDPNLNLDEATLKTLLRQSRFLLLIDGLNELPSEDAWQQVATFRRDYPQTPMIFTTRYLGVGGDLGIDKKLEMQPLTETQMREFVLAYLPQQGKQMLQQLKDRLREFGQTPLLLWMLCGLFEQTKTIPSNLGLVFRLFTKGYEQNLRGDVLVAAESRRWWPQLLQHLAFMMMQGEPSTEFRVAISRQEAEDILTQFLEQEKFDKPRDYAKRWLDDLLKHHLIQIENNNQIEFRHQLIQEYYAAEYLLQQLDRLSDAKLKRDYLNYLKWTEPVALMLALVDNQAKALRVVQLAFVVDLMLGARLAREVKSDFSDEVKKLIDRFEIPPKHRDWLLNISPQSILNAKQEFEDDIIETYGYALVETGKINGIPVMEYKQPQISTPQFTTCENLVLGYKQTNNDELLVTSLKNLKDENFMVRFNAAITLGEIGDERAVIDLAEAVNDKFFVVVMVSVSALGKIGSLTAISAIHQAFKHQEPIVRIAAISALYEIGNEVVVPILIESLQDTDFSVREISVDALREIGSEKAICSLQKTLNDTEYSVVWRVANALKLIQERCKFYNYEIAPSPPIIEESNTDDTPGNTTIIYDQRGAIIGNVAHNVHGNQQTLSVKPNEDSQPT